MAIKLKWIGKTSLQQKLSNYLFIGIFMPIIVLVYIQSIIGTGELDKMLTQNTQQIVEQVDMMLAFYMRNMENVMSVMESLPCTIDFIGGDANTDTGAELLRYMDSVENNYAEIAGALIAKDDGQYLSNSIVRKSKDSLAGEDWYMQAMEDPESYIFISKPLGRNLAPASSYSEDEIMCIVKAIKDPATGRYGGVLLLDFYLSALDRNIKESTLGSEGFLYVTDSVGNMIYAPYNDVVYRIDNAFVLEREEEKTVFRIHDKLYQVICKKSGDWNIVGVFLVLDVMSSVNLLKYVTITLFIGTLALVQFFSARLNKMLFVPLYELQKLMLSAENGTIDVQFPVETDDEIGALGKSFNLMINEIKKLLIIIEEENKLKREAEIKVLQEQIKPHFLYNTLDTINWIALECGSTEIVKLVTALTNLFRISLSKGKEYITVENEIEQVKNYLIIQTIRYEDVFDYSFDIEPGALPYYLLKLILQPLVENSIYHGVKEKEGFSHISISARRADDRIILTVKDTGVGISPQLVDEINDMFSSGKQTVGYGLFNVSQRMRYAFGAAGRLEIKSALGQGTEVTVYHPLIVDDYDISKD